MALKLYHVDVRFSYYVLAENFNDSYHTAVQHFPEACKDTSAVGVCDVTEAACVESDWERSLPYSDKVRNPDKKTCGELFKELNQ